MWTLICCVCALVRVVCGYIVDSLFLVVCCVFEDWMYIFFFWNLVFLGFAMAVMWKKVFDCILLLFLASFARFGKLVASLSACHLRWGLLVILLCAKKRSFGFVAISCLPSFAVLFCRVLISGVIFSLSFFSWGRGEKKKKSLSCPALIRMVSADWFFFSPSYRN